MSIESTIARLKEDGGYTPPRHIPSISPTPEDIMETQIGATAGEPAITSDAVAAQPTPGVVAADALLTDAETIDIPDFSKPEDFGIDLAAPPTVGAEGAESESEIAAQPDVELPFQENGGAGEAGGLLNTADLDGDDELEEDGPVSALLIAQHIEVAPENITLPETCLPIGTEIVREAHDIWHFKLPGRQTIVARGRTLYGAMVDAGIVR